VVNQGERASPQAIYRASADRSAWYTAICALFCQRLVPRGERKLLIGDDACQEDANGVRPG